MVHIRSTIFGALALASWAAANVIPNPPNLVVKRADTWGGSVSLGPTKSTIVKAVTTIIPGPAPPTQNGVLFLWPGMSNGTGDLIQATLESWPSNSWCGAAAGQWCVRASVFGWFGQLDGSSAPVSGSDQVRIEYALQSDQNTWLQTVTNAVTGAVLSTYSSASGPYMRGYGTGTECNDNCSGTIAAQSYINTVITLASADTTFGGTIAVAGGATYSGLTSSEGGKVWSISSINIPAMTSAPQQTTTTKTTTTSSRAATTTTSKATTTSTTTKTTTKASTTSSGSCSAAQYAQCGGSGFSGCTVCASPYTCKYQNDWYSQCL
ncbi:hypothetical protein TWF481_007791 [Arthrobotrys musiformis]|uniref:CBM1 domain-containing protein n=1 Tax=Arthrobotrys musiformis TaxID=47236 RepID=A0AAV9W571_9PEZI